MLHPFIGAMAQVPRIEISPGVKMPLINFGVQHNHSLAIDLGARGLDTANVYGDGQQREVGKAVRAAIAAGIPRSELFVTTKIECCPGTAFAGKGSSLMCMLKKDPAKDIAHNLKELGPGLDGSSLPPLCQTRSLHVHPAMLPLVRAHRTRLRRPASPALAVRQHGRFGARL